MEEQPMFPQIENRANIERLLTTLGPSMGNNYDPTDESGGEEGVIAQIEALLENETDQEYKASIEAKMKEIQDNHLQNA